MSVFQYICRRQFYDYLNPISPWYNCISGNHQLLFNMTLQRTESVRDYGSRYIRDVNRKIGSPLFQRSPQLTVKGQGKPKFLFASKKAEFRLQLAK